MAIINNADRIAQFFKGKHVFITGGTGFLGKVMVEKLLRDCSEVATIYLLIRDKKGKNPSQRMEEIFNSPLFEKVRNTRPNAIKQLKAISGDISLPDLGISDADRALLIEKVNIVYHCAATTRFDETLKKSVILNTRGTHLMVELSEKFKNLDAFVHVSTAYCNLHSSLLREQLYDPPADPHEFIKFAETMDDAIMEIIEIQALKSSRNTYVFTKALSEAIVAKKMDNMKSLILRPSVVVPIFKDPIPGWTDNINGFPGLMIASGKGILRTLFMKEEGRVDFFPVDIVANAFLTATWNYVKNKDESRRVYNMASKKEIRITWGELINMGKKIFFKIPLNNCVWYPCLSMKTCRLHHNIAMFFTHWIPAYLLDAILFLAGQKRFMVRLQTRLSIGMNVLEYFINNEWDFVNDNLIYLRELQNKREKEKYVITFEDLNIQAYLENCAYAARIYLLKEMPETLPAARRHMKIMYWVDVIFKMLFWYLMFYLVTSYSETAKNASDYMFDYVKSYIPPSIMSRESASKENN